MCSSAHRSECWRRMVPKCLGRNPFNRRARLSSRSARRYNTGRYSLQTTGSPEPCGLFRPSGAPQHIGLGRNDAATGHGRRAAGQGPPWGVAGAMGRQGMNEEGPTAVETMGHVPAESALLAALSMAVFLVLQTPAKGKAADRILLDHCCIVNDPLEPSYVHYGVEDFASYLASLSRREVPVGAEADGGARACIAIGQEQARESAAPHRSPSSGLGPTGGWSVRLPRPSTFSCPLADLYGRNGKTCKGKV